MNQIKRQLGCTQSVDIETKKSRSNLHASLSPASSCIEDLSNELFYEIFDYLDGYDIYNGFLNLNIRFQNLITCSSLPFKIELNWQSESVLEQRYRHLIIPYRHRLLSLRLRDQLLIDNFFEYCTIDSSFDRLESIMLQELTSYKLLIILFSLNCLPRLFSLTIHLEEDYLYNLGDIYRLIFSLSTLKYNKLSLCTYEDEDIVVPMVINQKFSSIEYLVIDYPCTLRQLTTLLSHTPCLHHLKCERLVEPDTNHKKSIPIALSHVTHISIGESLVQYDEFEVIIKEISSQLQVLKIGLSWNATYLDANRWERLINKHMPNLKKFHFNCNHDVDDNFSVSPGYNFLSRFSSPFWLERKWFCELKIDRAELSFLIDSYKKEWFNMYEHIENETCSIQLTVEGHIPDEQTRLFIEKMKSNCVTTQFTHLNIDCHNIRVDMLIETICLFPNLDSLRISSIPHLQFKSLPVKDVKKQLLLSTKNKITKVKVNMITEKHQIQFLTNLFPRMQYLEVDCMSSIDPGILLKLILMNQMTHVPNLCFVCLNVPNANEDIIRALSVKIDLETLIDNYTFRRIGDKIFLHWNIQ